MQLIKNKETFANRIFMIGLLLELFVMVVGHSSFVQFPFIGRMTHIAFVLFGVKIVMTYYSKLQWVFILLSGILGAISYLTCGDEYVIRAVVFIFATKGVEIKKTLQILFYVMVVGFIS